MNKPESLITYVQDRSGHGFGYSLERERFKELGWSTQVKLEDGLKGTTDWHVANRSWWGSLV